MVLPASGQLDFSQIQTEHSGSNPIGLNEYYRGGSLTAFNPQNTNIPTSGEIGVSDFYSSRGFGATNGFIFNAASTGGKTPSIGYYANNGGNLGTVTQSSATLLSTKITLIAYYIATYGYTQLKSNSPSAATQNFMSGKKIISHTSSFNGPVASYEDYLNGNNNFSNVAVNVGPFAGSTYYPYSALGWNSSPNRSGQMNAGTTYYVNIENR